MYFNPLAELLGDQGCMVLTRQALSLPSLHTPVLGPAAFPKTLLGCLSPFNTYIGL